MSLRLAFTSTPLIAALLAAGACGGDSSGDPFSSASVTASASATDSATAAGTDSATASGGTAATSGTAGSTTSGSGGTKYDVGAGSATATTTDGMPDECTKVDILFVVDDSGSMADNQQSLVNSFPGFVAGIQANLANAESYHVGVVTSDAYYAGNEPGCQEIGDLVTKTGGPESSNMTCAPYSSGKRYMDDTEPDLAGKFACAAKPGSGGDDDERVMRGLLDALSPAKNAAGACNDGFSRPDALLVIVIITDEDDVAEPYGCDPGDPFGPNPCMTEGSGGDPDAWYQEVVSYKGGIPENIVVLSLIGRGPMSSCGAVVNSKVLGFTNRFDANGFVGDVCWSDYSTFFTDALPVVDMACQNFVPPG